MNWKRMNFQVFIFIILFLIFFIPNGEFNEIIGKNYDTIQNENVLTIVVSLDVTITNEFEEYFLNTPQAVELGITDIDFKHVPNMYEWKLLLDDPSKSVDLAWGYTIDYFFNLEKWNLLKPITNYTLLEYINSNIPSGAFGMETKHYNKSDLIWFGTSFRAYGYTVNHEFLDMYDLPIPNTWGELSAPVFYISSEVNSISMSHPAYSSSNTRIYQIILQAYGWSDGWSILTRMGGNSGIYPGSVETRAAVVDGEVGVGLTTSNFGFIAMRENNDTEFIIPEEDYSFDLCPISLGINCDNQAAAAAFLQFIVSPEGQSVWLNKGIDIFPMNVRAFDTPLGQTRLDMYEYLDDILGPPLLFDYTFARETYHETFYYFHDTIAAKHTLLQNAWGMMVQMFRNETINSTYFIDLVDKLVALPENFECSDDSDPYPLDRICPIWRSFAQDKYQAIIEELTLLNNPTTNSTSTTSFSLIVLMSFVIALIYLRIKKKKYFF